MPAAARYNASVLLGNFPKKVEVIRFQLQPDYPRLDVTGDFFGSAAPE
jgi:hypothetical protein